MGDDGTAEGKVKRNPYWVNKVSRKGQLALVTCLGGHRGPILLAEISF